MLDMLDKLKTFDADRTDVDEMVSLSAFARNLDAEYDALGLDVPEWLETKIGEVKREIEARLEDIREKRIKELERGLVASRTLEEKKADMKKELVRLKSKRLARTS